MTRDTVGYITQLLSAKGSWGPANEKLICTEVIERMAPGVSSAKFLMVSETRKYAWQWREVLGTSEVVRVTSDQAAPSERTCVFVGFLVDYDMHFSGKRDDVIVTAMSSAWRLRRDTCVYGRRMLQGAATQETELLDATGLRCHFNAGGLPNRRKEFVTQWSERVGIVVHGTATTLPVFTYDGDPDAEHWTLWQAVRYLQAMANDEKWATGFPMTDELVRGAGPIVNVDVEGKDMWTAVAGVCGQAGYDLAESLTDVDINSGKPKTAMSIVKWGEGQKKTVMHQAPDVDDDGAQSDSPLDLNKTNLFSSSLAESVASSVTRPIVAGGREIIEITIPLHQAWSSAYLNTAIDDVIMPGDEAASATTEYVKRFYTRGDDHNTYSDVGRLWDANTDDRYSAAPWSCPDGSDVGALADYSAGDWPKMPYAPKPCLTRHGYTPTGKASQEAVLEVSFDSGGTWSRLGGFRVLPDRLGVRLTAANLASIVKPQGDKDTAADTLIGCLIENAASVAMRLTCSVVSPFRRIEQPTRRQTAGTPRETVQWYDRSASDAARRRSGSSIFSGSEMPADTADAGNTLSLIATGIQDALEGKTIEANLPIEWPDQDLQLTDVITDIAGIDFSLGTVQGARKVHPRIVGRTLHLGQQSSMSISLGSTRKAGIV